MHILTKQYLSKQKEYLDLKRIEDAKTPEQKEAEEDMIHEAHMQKMFNSQRRQYAIKLKQKEEEEELEKEKLINPKPDIKNKKKHQELYTHHGSRSLLVSADMFDSDSD